jgi:hypothetical protein
VLDAVYGLCVAPIRQQPTPLAPFMRFILADVGQPFHKVRKKAATTQGLHRTFKTLDLDAMRLALCPPGPGSFHLAILRRTRSSPLNGSNRVLMMCLAVLWNRFFFRAFPPVDRLAALIPSVVIQFSAAPNLVS